MPRYEFPPEMGQPTSEPAPTLVQLEYAQRLVLRCLDLGHFHARRFEREFNSALTRADISKLIDEMKAAIEEQES